MWKEPVPFCDGEVGVNGAECGDEVILECAYSTFRCICSVFFSRDSLEIDCVFCKRIFQILGAFVVEYVQVGWMTLSDEYLVCLFPRVADASSLTIGDGLCMDRIGILMIQHKNIVIAAAGRDWESSRLV